MKKQIFTLVLTSAFALCTVFGLAGCNKQEIGNTTVGGDGTNGTLKISCTLAGYGTDWLEKMADIWGKANNVTVDVKQSTNSGEEISRIESDQSNYDIVMTVGSQFKLRDKGKLMDLKDVYDSIPEGETKTVREKTQKEYYDLLVEDDGSIYFMNWADALDGIFYNATTLDEIFGAGNWKIPNTTDELIDLCWEIEEHEPDSAGNPYYGFVTSTQVNYWDYLTYAWGAQYDGVDEYFNYYQLKYTDEDGTVKDAENYQQMSPAGRLEALKVEEEILNKDNGINHPDSTMMGYLDAQYAFAGGGYRTNKSKVAFIVSGDWMENELTKQLANNPQDIGMMRTPVISSIVNKFEGTDANMKDNKLSFIVEQIDAGKSFDEVNEALAANTAGVDSAAISQSTYDKIYEARRVMCVATMDHMVGVPVTAADNKANIVSFLTFMTSETAQQIYAQTLKGKTMIYGYEPAESECSDFVKSVNKIKEAGYDPVYCDYSSPYVYNGGLRYIAVNTRYSELVKGTMTAEELNTEMDNNWIPQFDTIKKNEIK